MVALSAGGVLLTRLALDTPLPLVVAAGAVVGTGMGVTSTTLIVLTQNAVGWDQRGAVTGALQFCQAIGGTLWVSVQGALLSAALLGASTGGPTGWSGAGAVSAMLDPTARGSLPPEQLQAVAQTLAGGLHQVFVLYLAAALVGLLIVSLLPAPPAALTAGSASDSRAATRS
jgi:hypothetical protein